MLAPLRKHYLISLYTDFIFHCPTGLHAMDQPRYTDKGMCGHASLVPAVWANFACGYDLPGVGGIKAPQSKWSYLDVQINGVWPFIWTLV